jgi:predicted MPP superfamily phosphohydrolase
MKRFYNLFQLFVVALMLMNVAVANAQNANKLSFRSNGTFKIVQFTDTHIVWEDSCSNAAYDCIDKVVKSEHPDFIILTGDIIYSEPAIDNFKKVMNYVAQYRTPFAFVFGNHDHQFNVTDRELLTAVKDIPYNMTTTIVGVSGDSNFDLPVYAPDGQNVKAVLYGFDSHNDLHLRHSKVKGYDYIYRDQIDWYVRTSKNYTLKNNGVPIPSLAFFHIPLPEYWYAAADPVSILYGTRREPMCNPKLNSGLFCAMEEQGDIMGMFCGHDHDNDYAVSYYDILLAYGRFSGGNTEYNHLNGNGARVVEMKEGERSFKTWIRLRNGAVEQVTTFPKDYVNR